MARKGRHYSHIIKLHKTWVIISNTLLENILEFSRVLQDVAVYAILKVTFKALGRWWLLFFVPVRGREGMEDAPLPSCGWSSQQTSAGRWPVRSPVPQESPPRCHNPFRAAVTRGGGQVMCPGWGLGPWLCVVSRFELSRPTPLCVAVELGCGWKLVLFRALILVPGDALQCILR